MQIHWYPGHMHKAQRKIGEMMHKVDVVIEVLDARLPDTSTNPLVAELRGEKPCLKVLSKSDLADPEVTNAWRDHFKQQVNVESYLIRTDKPQLAKNIPDLCKAMLPNRGTLEKPVRAMIMGIPNVGKSTLINTLSGRKIARTGDEPAVTKTNQKINCADGFVLYDTPGILWPSPKSEISGYRLAASGAIRDTAMDYDEVAMFACDYMLQRYPDLLKERYNLKELFLDDPYETLGLIAARRGCIRKGGFDLQKVSELFIKDIRAARVGNISFEEPGNEIPYRELEKDPNDIY